MLEYIPTLLPNELYFWHRILHK